MVYVMYTIQCLYICHCATIRIKSRRLLCGVLVCSMFIRFLFEFFIAILLVISSIVSCLSGSWKHQYVTTILLLPKLHVILCIVYLYLGRDILSNIICVSRLHIKSQKKYRHSTLSSLVVVLSAGTTQITSAKEDSVELTKDRT